jgi:predicted RNA binding protein YcfA (HicA-like mRNA interferase family)
MPVTANAECDTVYSIITLRFRLVTLDQGRDGLRAGKGSIRCAEVVSILRGLGFAVEARRRGKHHVYMHPAIIGITGGNFACPHAAGGPVKNNYITKILGVLRDHEGALEAFLRGGK